MDEREFSAGKVTYGRDPWGMNPKDRILAGAGMLAGPGMALGLGQGVARPLASGLGGEALRQLTGPQMDMLAEMAKTFGRGAVVDLMRAISKPKGMLPKEAP